MMCAAAVSAQFIAGKATRDALYLGALDVTSLPVMVMATAAFSLALVALSALTLRRISPAVAVPAAFVLNAVLLLIEWALVGAAPTWAARAVYLHFSGLGPMLGSGFWLIATELFDPRTARRNFGQIAGVGTLSGLGGALVAERVATFLGVAAMLPILAGLSLLGAWQIRRLATRFGESEAMRPVRSGLEPETIPVRPASLGGGPEQDGAMAGATDLLPDSPQSGLRALAQASYLRNLAMLVLLGTAAATLVDYAFKVKAVEAFGDGDRLLRFFAIYYAGTSLIAFAVQAGASTFSLERFGLALTTSSPSLALAVGGVVGMLLSNFEGVLAARAGEAAFRGSLFRTGYELFFTPIPSTEKRAAKSVIDVGFDRLGDAIGGGVIRLLLVLVPATRQTDAILGGAVLCSLAALVVARRLNQGYVHTLERSLMSRAVELELDEVEDLTTRTTLLRTLNTMQLQMPSRPPEAAGPTSNLSHADPEVQEIVALRSRDRDRVLTVLRDEARLPRSLVPHVVPLLAWDPVAEDAIRALRAVVDAHVGELIDVLVDASQPFAIRRRLARVLAAASSQRAVDGLLLGLDDRRFEVRFHCGRALAAILARNPGVHIDSSRVFDVVRGEVEVERTVWESHKLLDQIQEDEPGDDMIKARTSRSLGHVFTLLSLVLQATPLQIAYRGLQTSDRALRGTALEYLEEVLPPDIRKGLWPFLGDDGPERLGEARSRDDVLADLLRSNESIELNLKEIRRNRRVTDSE
jgi:hypothetical protein